MKTYIIFYKNSERKFVNGNDFAKTTFNSYYLDAIQAYNFIHAIEKFQQNHHSNDEIKQIIEE